MGLNWELPTHKDTDRVALQVAYKFLKALLREPSRNVPGSGG
jgi:hypothetical protein